ncbi:sec-independent protein translocase protein TatA [Deinococcus reticulitermitis]|uniref:Sec-independent protein translocase protein TatA n=1 Tax=Deinococcus reticulitermitis TaxID=856736 RepID=A0A1H7CME5_9DEIO|nr:twin-arginine translocase TatA/TatE family subunit [Deinococcus reticulitermitis]SEJ90646.1 sec-independent protein translocase protein TatA [Deinococcus reticulitermitis]
MPSLGAGEILMILLVALLVFGPRKLPELGKSLGAGLREFRRSTQGLKEEFEGTMRGDVQSAAPTPVQVIAAQPQVQQGPATPVAASAVIPRATSPAPAGDPGGPHQG